jgi:two-component system response regulator RegX3
VLFVTARDAEEDIVSVLRAGADDYLVKPVRKFEMLARIEAVVRRARPEERASEVLVAGDISLDTGRREVTRKGDSVELTQKDFDLAVFLFRNQGRLLSRGHIYESVWGASTDINTRTIDTHVSRIRTRLSLTPENGWRLAAVYQHGYRLEKLSA